jgi:hypothetical protein
MRTEFELSRRSKLKTHTSELGDVISTLAANPQARNDFLRNPAAFLNQHHLPVDACKLGMDAVNHTTEMVSPDACVYVICDVVVYVTTSADCILDCHAVVIGPEPLPELSAQQRTPAMNVL